MRKFDSLDDFIRHLKTLPKAVVAAELLGLTEGAELVEREAKAELGNYQDAGGPFEAWPELAAATQQDRVRLGYSPDEPGLRRGDMRDSISHSVQAPVAVVGSNDPHLLWFELGTTRQPPRSVLGLAAFRHGRAVAMLIGAAVERAIAGLPLRPNTKPEGGAR